MSCLRKNLIFPLLLVSVLLLAEKFADSANLNEIPYEKVVAEKQQHSTINYETKWFRQLTDHFTWSNQDTWSQRYLVNQDHWCGKNCPILFYCGNEGDIEVFANNTGFMWENAEKLHAMLVFAEHRFYGQSFPYPVNYSDISPRARKTLGYLSSEQALADYARLIYSIRNELYDAKLSPIITIGGSYGGMLAAWMRMKYPNAVTGALAASAPIIQFPGEYNCQDFYRITTQDYENYNKFCPQIIAKSWPAIRQMTAGNNKAGLKKLSKIFNTCDELRNVETDVSILLETLEGIWVNLAMTDYANPANFLSNMPAYPIKHVCDILNQDPDELSDEQLLTLVSKGMQIYTNYTGTLSCLQIENYVYDPIDIMWYFQSCTEMVMPMCSDGINDMFEPHAYNVDEFVAECKESWGTNTDQNRVKILYGDKNLASYSNIIFSSCSRDPWSAGCPQTSYEATGIHAIKIPGVCHHEDLRASGAGDKDDVKKARQDELNIITTWIQEHYDNIKKFQSNATLTWQREHLN